MKTIYYNGQVYTGKDKNRQAFVVEDGKFGYTYQQFVLRQDENGYWKILVFYQIEGEESDDK